MRSPTWARQDGELWGSCPGRSGAGWLRPGGGEGREVSAVDPHPSQPLPASGPRRRTLGRLRSDSSPPGPPCVHSCSTACLSRVACFSTFLLPCHPWGLLFSSPWSLPIVGPLTVAVSEEGTVTLFQAGQGWPHCHLEMATPPGAARKGGALTAPSLSGCVSAPSGRRVRRNALPGRAAASAAQPQQRVRSPRRQAAPRAHQGTALQPTGFLPVSP